MLNRCLNMVSRWEIRTLRQKSYGALSATVKPSQRFVASSTTHSLECNFEKCRKHLIISIQHQRSSDTKHELDLMSVIYPRHNKALLIGHCRWHGHISYLELKFQITLHCFFWQVTVMWNINILTTTQQNSLKYEIFTETETSMYPAAGVTTSHYLQHWQQHHNTTTLACKVSDTVPLSHGWAQPTLHSELSSF